MRQAQRRRRRSDRRCRAVRARHPCRARSRRARAHHRGHRHQRQIHDHGADRSHPSGLRAWTRRSAAISASRCSTSASPTREDRLRARSVVLSDRAVAGPCRPMSRFSPISRPITSTATARWRTTRRSRKSLLKRAAPDGHVAVGVDDRYSAEIYTKLAGQPHGGRGGRLGRQGARPRHLRHRRKTVRRLGSALGADRRSENGSASSRAPQLAERGAGLCRGPPADPRSARDRRARSCASRALRIASKMSGASARSASSTIPRRRMPMPPRARSPASPISSGSPAASAKEGGIADLEPYFPRMRKAYLIGEAAESFGTTLAGKVAVVQSGTLERALKAAFDDARASEAEEPVVLLSPACASFDQFRDFEHRGDVFQRPGAGDDRGAAETGAQQEPPHDSVSRRQFRLRPLVVDDRPRRRLPAMLGADGDRACARLRGEPGGHRKRRERGQFLLRAEAACLCRDRDRHPDRRVAARFQDDAASLAAVDLRARR